MSLNPSSDLKPLAVVTGGSSGIGFELARQFAENGYDLVIVAERAGKLAEAAQALSGLGPDTGSQVESLSADLRTEEGVETLYGLLQGLGRPVDVLCANAGVGVWGDFTRETELREELDMLRLNVLSQVHLIKLVARDMVERDSGHILITASVAGAMPGPRMAVYAGSKAFLNSFGHALRNELSDTNVGVTILAPGPTETNFFDRADMEESKVAQQKKDDPADVAKQAYKALEHDRAHVVTGAKNKLQTGMAAIMPDKAKAAMHGNMTKPADE